MKRKTFKSIVILLLTAISAVAQTNEITYQGKLNDAGVPANGSYDMRFQVYAIVAGSQTAVGTPVERLGVTVTNGSFSVVIDLSHVITTFTGFDRFIGISVRPGGSGAPYTALLPTQKFTSTPYAIRSQNAGNASTATNATQLGGVEASQYVVTDDSRMTDARQPLPGSGDYIQNSTVAQSSSNFNISGDGTAAGTLSGNIVNATAGFNIGSTRVLSIRGTNNTLVGENAGGGVFSSGANNTLVGFAAGDVISSGSFNSFVGSSAGTATTTGDLNSFFGVNSGQNNTTGLGNSFFGANTGTATTTGNNNSFFGRSAGASNTTGYANAFFGALAGQLNSTGYGNSFFGSNAGDANLTGWGNSFFGGGSGSANSGGVANTFVGFRAGRLNIGGNGNSYFGNAAGENSTSANYNSIFGNQAGSGITTGSNNAFFGWGAGSSNTTGSFNTMIGQNTNTSSSGLTFATAIGAGAIVANSNTVVLGRSQDTIRIPGDIRVSGFSYMDGPIQILTGYLNELVLDARGAIAGIHRGGGEGSELCELGSGSSYYPTGTIARCSSSIRYKEDVSNFTRGVDLVRKLRPVTFRWINSGDQDVGFIAEEVADVDPLFAVYKDGQIESVKYKQLTTVLVNATMEQQAEIDFLKTEIEQQKLMIESLKQIVCEQNPQAAVCMEGN